MHILLRISAEHRLQSLFMKWPKPACQSQDEAIYGIIILLQYGVRANQRNAVISRVLC